jgi:DnaJ-class molecular chaperone
VVSRAFQVLSDADKKAKFDRFGGDPDSRHSQAAASSPFSGFASQRGGGRANGSMFDEAEEISPEELFRQFFGGGMGGGFPGFGIDFLEPYTKTLSLTTSKQVSIQDPNSYLTWEAPGSELLNLEAKVLDEDHAQEMRLRHQQA